MSSYHYLRCLFGKSRSSGAGPSGRQRALFVDAPPPLAGSRSRLAIDAGSSCCRERRARVVSRRTPVVCSARVVGGDGTGSEGTPIVSRPPRDEIQLLRPSLSDVANPAWEDTLNLIHRLKANMRPLSARVGDSGRFHRDVAGRYAMTSLDAGKRQKPGMGDEILRRSSPTRSPRALSIFMDLL